MELRQLRYFCGSGGGGHRDRGGRRLRLSQPPLTMQLHSLEEELGCALFEREGRRLRLTERGRAFYQRAKTILGAVRRGGGGDGDHSAGRMGTLRLGAISSVHGAMLLRWLEAYARRYPEVRLDLHNADTYQQLELIRTGQIDVALVRTPFSAPELAQLQLAAERMLAVALPGQLPPAVPLEALAKRRLLIYRRWEQVLRMQFEAAGWRCASTAAVTTPRLPSPWRPAAWGRHRPGLCPAGPGGPGVGGPGH